MVEALEESEVDPGAVEYVNAHATGTAAGDAVECAALGEVFPSPGPWINSSKSLLGHGFCAAGLVEAAATVVQLEGGFLHPNLNLSRPIDERLRFVGSRARVGEVRLALSNSYSYGGLHAGIVLRRAEGDS